MIVDTSRYQQQYRLDVQEIDFERARDEGGVTLAIPRGLQGIHEGDPFLPAALNGWRRVGVPAEIYHVFWPAQEPRQQARTFAQLVRALDHEGDVDSDFELTQGVRHDIIRAKALAYLEELEDQLQRSPKIYTGPWWWDPVIGRVAWAKRYKLWVADHRVRARPQLPLGWDDYERWQYTAKGTVPGIEGLVDLSRPRVYFPPIGGVYTVEITATALRIRSGPSTGHAILGRLMTGETAQVHDELGDWLRISPPFDSPAWIHGAWARRIS
jgi:GH25 family lysozyme M1 (1,4-beta-N-acetylmuramidase)